MSTYRKRFGVDASQALNSLRKANDCMIFSANDLRQISGGNVVYGAFTYVLNAKMMKDRLFWEVWDSAETESLYTNLSTHAYPGLGTYDDFLHLIQPHEELWNMPAPAAFGPDHDKLPCCNYSLASLLNRWLVPGTPVPNSATSGTYAMDDLPYFEVVVAGNPWLPEDLLFSVAQFVSDPTGIFGTGSAGIFGTATADQLRAFMIKEKRPLIWANGGHTGTGDMLIDPIVNNIAGNRITRENIALFKNWTDVSATGWDALVAAAPAHLHFKHPSYPLRHVCADIEVDSKNQVMGVDAEQNCVYWTLAEASSEGKWELLNDGTCARSDSERAKFTSAENCASGLSKWRCVTDIFATNKPDAHYCVPSVDGIFDGIDSCEQQCGNPVPVNSLDVDSYLEHSNGTHTSFNAYEIVV
jgi:hypothetical protein